MTLKFLEKSFDMAVASHSVFASRVILSAGDVVVGSSYRTCVCAEHLLFLYLSKTRLVQGTVPEYAVDRIAERCVLL